MRANIRRMKKKTKEHFQKFEGEKRRNTRNKGQVKNEDKWCGEEDR